MHEVFSTIIGLAFVFLAAAGLYFLTCLGLEYENPSPAYSGTVGQCIYAAIKKNS